MPGVIKITRRGEKFIGHLPDIKQIRNYPRIMFHNYIVLTLVIKPTI